jgi:DNA-binding NarL/FixJ family response regulator
MTFRILMADEHSVVRRGPRTFPGLESEFAIVGEAANGAERGTR